MQPFSCSLEAGNVECFTELNSRYWQGEFLLESLGEVLFQLTFSSLWWLLGALPHGPFLTSLPVTPTVKPISVVKEIGQGVWLNFLIFPVNIQVRYAHIDTYASAYTTPHTHTFRRVLFLSSGYFL